MEFHGFNPIEFDGIRKDAYMIFHVVSLPHTQTTSAYVHCAYTEKVRKFCNMMKSLGHTVYLYASEENEAECDELITCITKEEQLELIGVAGPLDNGKAKFEMGLNYWDLMNNRATTCIMDRAKKTDFICLIAGLCQKPIADALPGNINVEFGIGYGGVFSNYRVFESYAWMHTIYGAQTGGNAAAADGKYYDCVIPNYYEPKDFEFCAEKEDYFLFMGRLIDRKGYQVAVEVCKILGKRLIIAGQGTPPEYGEYVGVVRAAERSRLMSRAQAVFVPTQYVGPFEGVSVEAMLCGTPIITSDWGCFVENNQHGKTGFRCRTMGEYVEAARKVHTLDYAKIRQYALMNFSVERVKYQYQDYFEQLETLWEKGFYSEWHGKHNRYCKIEVG